MIDKTFQATRDTILIIGLISISNKGEFAFFLTGLLALTIIAVCYIIFSIKIPEQESYISRDELLQAIEYSADSTEETVIKGFCRKNTGEN